MQIDWMGFSPTTAGVGGAMIGAAAGLLFLALGRVAGVSGVLAGLVPSRAGDAGWRIAFLAGLFAAGVVASRLGAPAPVFTSNHALLAVGGLLVGFGARLGGGCTSGHGVCGLSRLSSRSLVATIVFMTTAIATVYISRHVFQ
jgi:uncharacterized protein